MFSLLSSRRIAVAAAGAALLSMTAACGGAANAEVCTEAQSLLSSSTTTLTSAGADPAKFNAATKKVADDFKALAAKTDGDLATAINGYASIWENIKVDAGNPAGLATALQDAGAKSQAFGNELTKACS
ncbi:hypothetical protein [Planomonospora parontospora]|uniref:hypothetical protein n=1 Tax=Planomonospora parontospora TaxID=58119 RepID=UPI00166FB94F|nr:hypothetical protein [Planomonospora parontospora]GGL30648.1 hypothetical protein GCM10014719_34990 [Planomonospora parontospora subsp. antibiotica]GII16688.1 hypothetical protein Ppa05_34140 [Planomonospora parontospora subsp. antibiotica]